MCSRYGAIPNYPTLDLLKKNKEKKKKEKAASTYHDMQSLNSAVVWNMPVCFFLVPGCKISRAAPLHTTRASLPLPLQRASVGTSFLDSSPVSIAHEAIPCTWLQYAKDAWNKYLTILACFHTWTVCFVPKEIICSKSIAYFPWVVLSSHCIIVKTLKPSLKPDPDEISCWYHCNHCIVLSVK